MPTDEDWGRLYQFDTTGDAGLVMPPRSYYFRDFHAGSWVELAVGIFYCARGSTGDDESPIVDERLPETNRGNLFHFGISQSQGSSIDVVNNPYFVGIQSILGGLTEIDAGGSAIDSLTMCLKNGTDVQVEGSPIVLPLSHGISGTPFSFVGLKFIYDSVAGILYVNYETDATLSLADEEANITEMTSRLLAISNSTVGSHAQFNITSLLNFKTFYLYWPFLDNRLKLHTVGAVKYA